MTVSGEDALIAKYFAPLARHPAAQGLLDDAAVLTPEPGHDLVITKDALVAGVHFFADDPPAAIAQKALRVNLSDLAAKAAEPVGYLLALALPSDVTEDWLAGFARGLAEDSERFGAPLLGGDTVKARGALTLCITAIGRVPAGLARRRTGAKPGDALYVTGTIGDAALGLRLRLDPALAAGLVAEHVAFLTDRYLYPEPRFSAVTALRDFATAAMDISDGLAGDLDRMLAASKVGARVEAALVPVSSAGAALLARDGSLFETVLTGGDDYELLCAVDPGKEEAFRTAVGGTRIGHVTPGPDVLWVDAQGAPMTFGHPAYSHF